MSVSAVIAERSGSFRLGPPVLVKLGGLIVQITDDARRAVVFFGKPSPPDGEIKYGGTGFLLLDTAGENVPYLVTCRHVAKELEDDFIIRVNKRGGGSIPLEVTHQKWRWSYHPDESVDIAATVLPLDASVYDVAYFNLRKLIQIYDADRVMCGGPVCLAGLFRLHAGTRRNVVIVHSGHIAAVPDPHEKIPIRDRVTDKITEVEAYLIEAQTLEGLSGSPVFIQELGFIPGLKTREGGTARAYGDVKLLGIYQAAWDGEPGTILAADRNLAGKLRVPVGMGVAVPGERIIELINNDPEFNVTREKLCQARLKRGAAMTDALPFAGSEPSGDDDKNPYHLEDFTALLNAATRKPQSKD